VSRTRLRARARDARCALPSATVCVRRYTRHTAREEVGLRRHFRPTGIRTMNELVRVIAPTYDLSRGQIASDNTHVGSRGANFSAKGANFTAKGVARVCRSPPIADDFTRLDLETDLQPRRLSPLARARVRVW